MFCRVKHIFQKKVVIYIFSDFHFSMAGSWKSGRRCLYIELFGRFFNVLQKSSSFVGRNAFSKQNGRSYIYLVAVRFTFIFTEDNGHRKDLFEAFFRFFTWTQNL